MKVYHSDNYEPRQPRKKDHKCPHCNKMFAFNGNLIRHMETHDPTSRLAEERYNLKLGRLKRVQKDGTIVTLPEAKRLTMLSDEYIYEETEEQEPHDKNEKFNEQEYEDDYTNDDNIHYVYEEFEDEDYEDQGIEEEEEDITSKKSMIEIKMEKIELMENTRTQQAPSNQFKTEDNGADEMSLEANEEQGFMVIEVLPDEDEVGDEDVAQTPHHNSHKVVYIKDNKPSSNETITSDYFGFEVSTAYCFIKEIIIFN